MPRTALNRGLLLVAVGALVGAAASPSQSVKTVFAATMQDARAVDPVCNIVVRKDPSLSFEYAGETYYFCMNADLEAFKADPQRFLGDDRHRHPAPND